MSAKQVSSGYILWKTDPEPVRHSHSGERRLLTAPPPGLAKHTGGKFHQAGEYAAVGSMGENRLPQPTPVPKRFPGVVWKRSGCPGSACYKGIPRSSAGGGGLPQTGLFKETSKKKCGEGQAAPGCACSEEIAGTGQTGGISPEASAWGPQPADARTEKHPEGHWAFRVFCYAREITSSGRFRTTAGSPSDGAAGAGACPTGTAHGFRP